MLLRWSTVVTLGVMLLFVHQSFSQSKSGDNAQQVNQKLSGLVHNILEGQNLGEAKASIAPDAYVIDGTSYESLIGAINGEFKDCKVVEGKGLMPVFEHLTFTPDKTAAFMILIISSPKESKQFHSIVFFKGHDEQWKIVSWHISK